MQESLIFTIIGSDKPGLVESISACVTDHQCNWLGSRMSRLGGKFAGMVQVEGNAEQLEKLRHDLTEISGLTVVAETGDVENPFAVNSITVTMLGLDRPGIVREVSGALASQGLNVVNLETDVSKAAMTGRLMFHGSAVVAVEGDEDLGELSERLDEISNQLGVDIELDDQGD